MIGGVLSFLGGAWKFFAGIFLRKNQPDIVANEVACEDSKREDDIAALESAAAAGDPKALEEMRRKLAE
jgi:hypothetical protein